MKIDLRMGDLDGGVYRHQKSLLSLLRLMTGVSLTMAEVGVFAGATSEYLLRNEPRLRLHMIDPWRAAEPDSTYAKSGDRVARLTQDEMNALARQAAERTAFAEGRRWIHPATSLATAEWLVGPFDLVFIDAEHTYEGASTDIAAWWPKVRPGGILAGHDYNHRRYPGVTQAVNEFVAEALPTIELQTLPGKVWWVRKP